MVLGVGIVGCGQVVQAIHLPALASLPKQFAVVHTVDASGAVAKAVGQRVGARHGTDVGALLDDPAVDVVLVAVPDGLHPRVAVDACRAGKRAVLVEKPLALTTGEAHAIAFESARTGVPVVVGTMHRFDAAFTTALPMLPDADAVAIETVFGPNAAFVADAVELVRGRPDVIDAQLPMAALGAPLLHAGLDAGPEWLFGTLFLLGLSTHDLALLRAAHGEPSEVRHAEVLGGRGLHVVLGYPNGLTATLTAYDSRTKFVSWKARWLSADRIVDVTFPQSWGASEASVLEVHQTRDGSCHTERWSNRHETGFRQEWRHVHAVALGDEPPVTSAADAAADVALIERIVAVGTGRRPKDGERATGVALVGAGWANAVHGPIVGGHPQAEVRAVASRTARSAERQAWPHGARAVTTDDLPAALHAPDIDVVIVAGPPATHAEYALAALAAGKRVLIEKPLCSTLAGADAVVAAGGTAGYLENWAAAPVVASAIDLVRAGRVGAPRSVTVRALHGPPAYGSFLEPAWGGGCLFDLGAHPVWWALALLADDPVVSVRAVVAADDTYGEAELTTASGVSATVISSWQQAGEGVIDAVVAGSGATLTASLSPHSSLVLDPGGPVDLPVAHARIGGWARKNGYVQQLERALGPEGPLLTAADGRAVLEVLSAAYASAGQGGAAVAVPFTGDRTRSPYELWHQRSQ